MGEVLARIKAQRCWALSDMAVALRRGPPYVNRLLHGQRAIGVDVALQMADQLRCDRLALVRAVLQNEVWQAGLDWEVAVQPAGPGAKERS